MAEIVIGRCSNCNGEVTIYHGPGRHDARPTCKHCNTKGDMPVINMGTACKGQCLCSGACKRRDNIHTIVML